MKLFFTFLKHSLSAHGANPANLFAGMSGMLLNNLIFLWGMWGMLFDGKKDNTPIFYYFCALTAIINLSWGSINFFMGGLRGLGDLIVEGNLEPLLCTPRHSLFLVACSQANPMALGDIITGLIALSLVIHQQGVAIVWPLFLSVGICSLSLAALFIFTGSFAFFITKGNYIGLLLNEITLALSSYPTGKILINPLRLMLFLTPAYITTLLPMEAFENPSFQSFGLAFISASLFLAFSIGLFQKGKKRYQSINLMRTQ